MSYLKRLAFVAAGLALAACATMPVSGPSTPTGPAAIPSAPLDLGDWRRASASSTMQHFESTVRGRYGVGLTLASVTADLRRQEFSCAPPQRDGRGDPPAQVCRRAESASGCTHTWQVHLFDEGDNARLARTRALYDRSCAGDGLLGGPG